ncbi:SidA/IucD/PvdA family monooxygenase, partial [Embleya sp. NPDC005575]|uniref:SidA/IucD/PvdA family monooxygenase n=1 Tax=Embleya sp. NPDC005575 TaxID=3156892 RepID=UPI0033BD5B38
MTVAIVGAGPYGLSLAAHLRQLGVTTRVFGRPMESWRRHMPVGMLLKSRPDASSIAAPRPGFDLAGYQRDRGERPLTGDQPVPRETFAAYGRWYADRLVPDVDRMRITGVEPAGHGFALGREDGTEVEVDAVVLATGLAAHRYVPPVLERLGADLVSHSAEHADLAELGADRDIVVIGSGQSALESAALLHEGGAARVRVFGRATSCAAAAPAPPAR